MDEKEQAWLRRRALEIAGEYSAKGERENLADKMDYANLIYGCAVTGVSPYCASYEPTNCSNVFLVALLIRSS